MIANIKIVFVALMISSVLTIFCYVIAGEPILIKKVKKLLVGCFVATWIVLSVALYFLTAGI